MPSKTFIRCKSHRSWSRSRSRSRSPRSRPFRSDCTCGKPGPRGKTGRTGDKGCRGSGGVNGTNGTNGAPGATGSQGLQGLQGLQGQAGQNGNDGAPGSQGPQGPPGPQGLQGLQGLPGQNGNNGTPGAPGPQGPQGPVFTPECAHYFAQMAGNNPNPNRILDGGAVRFPDEVVVGAHPSIDFSGPDGDLFSLLAGRYQISWQATVTSGLGICRLVLRLGGSDIPPTTVVCLVPGQLANTVILTVAVTTIISIRTIVTDPAVILGVPIGAVLLVPDTYANLVIVRLG